MKKGLMVIGVIIVLSITSASRAGWFSKIKSLKPLVGYTESKEEVEAPWGECIKRHNLGVQTISIDSHNTIGNLIFSASSIYCISATSFSGETRIGDTYFNHECPNCERNHIKDYPKTEIAVTGKQYKITTSIYKDGKLVSKIVEYTYPHKKIEKKTTTKIEYKKEVEITNTTGLLNE